MEDVLDTIISNQVMKQLCYFLLAFTLLKGVLSEDQPSSSTTHCIEGKVSIASTLTTDQWLAETVIVLDGGNYHGFPTANGKFSVCDVPPGTYLVEVVSPNDVFEPVRVDISAKSGKIRARKVNILKTKSVSHLPYPLSFKNEQRTLFFTKREPWSILSVLKNPMVLFMVAPLLLMMVIPRLMKSMNPEQQKEMQESMSSLQPGSSLPSLEDMFTNMFGGQSSQAPKKKVAKKTKH